MNLVPCQRTYNIFQSSLHKISFQIIRHTNNKCSIIITITFWHYVFIRSHIILFSFIWSQITTTRVRIVAWAYLKGVSSLISLHYLWRSLGALSLPYAVKHQLSSYIGWEDIIISWQSVIFHSYIGRNQWHHLGRRFPSIIVHPCPSVVCGSLGRGISAAFQIPAW